MVRPRQKDARGQNTKINYAMDTRGERDKKRTSKKNVDGRITSSHDSKKFRTRSMEKQGGMAFGFRKTATVVIKPYTEYRKFEANSSIMLRLFSSVIGLDIGS
jgi:hypothetical protein